MKRKILTVALAMAFGLTSILTAGCGGEDDSTEATEYAYTDTTIYGEVTAVGDS